MSKPLASIVPDPEALLALAPEELAGVVLEHLNSLPDYEQAQINRHNFSQAHNLSGFPVQYQDQILRALMEAWVWLEREGLLAPKPGTQGGGWVFITRRGKRLLTAQDVAAYRRSNLLPQQLLHPVLAQKTWPAFLRGDYDVAVFQGFKEVEVAVRAAGRLSPTDLGTQLMRKAFEKSTGPLTETAAPESEKEAMAHLFAGAIGCYKNPHSHRNVAIDASEAVELLLLASHLLRIVDARSTPP